MDDKGFFDGIGQLVLNLGGNRPRGMHPEKKMVYDTNLRMIRVGCIIRKDFGGTYKYLLGRLEKRGQKVSKKLKTSGGYLRLAANHHERIDRSALEGILRETAEEGFTGRYRILPESIAPLGVHLSEEKGVLQFYSAELLNYPRIGVRSEAVFKRRKDHTIYIRWCSVDELVDSMQRRSGRIEVPAETVDTIAAAHFFDKSRKVDFERASLSRSARYGSDLRIPDVLRSAIMDRAGIGGQDYERSMRFCSVHYSVPKTPRLLAVIPYVRIFFRTDLFLRETRLDLNELETWRPLRGPGRGSVAEWAEGAVRRFVIHNYEKVLHRDLLRDYIA